MGYSPVLTYSVTEIVAASTSALRASTAASVNITTTTRTTSSQTASTSTIPPTKSPVSQVNSIDEEGSGESSAGTTPELLDDVTRPTSITSEASWEPSEKFDAALVQASASIAENDIESRSETSANGFLELPDSSEEESMEDMEEDDPLFNYTISSNCTAKMRNQASVFNRSWLHCRGSDNACFFKI